MFKILESTYGHDYIYRQLAEECAELAQASLKIIRANHRETPMSAKDAMASLLEEIADVQVMIDAVMGGMAKDQTEIVRMIRLRKERRMLKRAEIAREAAEVDELLRDTV